jgi:oligopeptidase B
MPLSPPLAPRRDFAHTDHGVVRPDPWHWLKDRDDPATIPHLEAENGWTEAACAHLADLRQRLYDEMLARIQEDDASVPVAAGGWVTWRETVQGKPYTVHWRRRDAAGAPAEVVLDENALAEGRAYFKLDALALSRDHRFVAWLQDVDGGERFTLHVRDLATGEDRQLAENLKWSLAWSADGRFVFATRGDAAQRPHQVWRFPVDGGAPTLVADEPDERFFLEVSRTRDWRYVRVEASSKTTSEIALVPGDAPDAAPRLVWPRRQGVLYDVTHHDGRLLLLANDTGPNFRVVEVPADAPEAPPRELRAHDPDVYITRIDAFARHLVLWERRDGMPAVTLRTLATGEERRIAFPEPAFDVAPDENPSFAADVLRLTYTSPRTPPTVYACDLQTGGLTTLKVHPVRGYDAGSYRVALRHARAPDGQDAPITVFHRGDVGWEDGPLPALLIGYGSYGLSYPASFRSTVLSLVDRGLVVAIAHVRGGSERGRWWYEHGKLEHKTATFTDFIAAAEHLCAAGITAPDRLGIQGGSAGGLLVGAVINLRPNLFRVAIAKVPFVDALNTMLDATLPLTVTEYEEWGDPNDPAVFDRLRSYAPYENVHAAAYPAVLATAGLNDPRVGYWEPAKWVQALRAATTSARPILFRVHLGAGHGGQSGRYGQLDDLAWEYAFLLDQLGVDVTP